MYVIKGDIRDRHGIGLTEVLGTIKLDIPLPRKTIRVGSSRWLRSPTPQFHAGDTNMLVSNYH